MKLVPLLLFFLLPAAASNAAAQNYIPPQDSLTAEKLEKWQDLKFGVIFHWGLYSIPGIVESWSICSEDVEWINRRRDLGYEEYKEWYWGLKQDFDPASFNPDEWAEIMDDGGVRYMIFTTKHHDGFCMFDTGLTDFFIASTPFFQKDSTDITYEVLRAFRDKGFMVGTYFSKPDWHCGYYWWDQYATPDRHVNYDIGRHPERWKKFCDYTAAQIGELMSRYGKVDILWLDGGWVAAPEEDISIDSIVAYARKSQPGLITVDRSVHGPNENYFTPERGIPEERMEVPWESCIPLSNDWGWVPDAPYKPASEVLRTLIEIVAKGGSMLLGIGPDSEGRIESRISGILHEVGAWLKENGEAIYGTRSTPYYKHGDIWFTSSKDTTRLYAIYARPDSMPMPAEISWKVNLPSGRMRIVSSGQTVKYRIQGDSVIVRLPSGLKDGPVALVFEPLIKEAYKNPHMPVDARIADLLGKMTIEEKIGQLLCLQGWEMYERNNSEANFNDNFTAAIDSLHIGSLYAVQRADPWTKKTLHNGLDGTLGAEVLDKMQRHAVENTKLGIPLLFFEECPHGMMGIDATVFPGQLCQASTWNPSLLYEMGTAIAEETIGRNANVCLGPILDIALDPRWSRTEETYGEDPYLTAVMATSVVKGIQNGMSRKNGRTFGNSPRAAATLKHFAAYGVPRGGHNGNPSDVNRLVLHNYHLPQFKKAVINGDADMIMTSYNTVDGIPASCNAYLLDTVLRQEWGFDGVVISDLFSIDGIVGNGTARNLEEAAIKSIEAGCDIDLGGNAYRELIPAINDGLIDERLIDRSVERIIRIKFENGLFDYLGHAESYGKRTTARNADDDFPGKKHRGEKRHTMYRFSDNNVFSEKHDSLALEIATEGIVLLENKNNLLPLSKNIRRIAVIGPNADAPYNMLGDYTAPQREGKTVTLLDGIRNLLPEAEILYAKGGSIRDTSLTDIGEAVKAAMNADVVILALGGSSARDFRTSYTETGAAMANDIENADIAEIENATTAYMGKKAISDMESGEGIDRATLELCGDQLRLLEAIAATGKPLITVYIQGRPLDMEEAASLSDALLTAWYPGEQGGTAIASILFGDTNPSGKLPISIPRDAGQLPIYYSQGSNNDYTDMPATPLYPFGYGLSYTDFTYETMSVESIGFTTEKRDGGQTFGTSEPCHIKVEITITNSGNRHGTEVVQLYIRDKVSTYKTSNIRLAGFERVAIAPGQSAHVTFVLPETALSYYHPSGKSIFENGEFEFMAGSSSMDIKLKSSRYLYR